MLLEVMLLQRTQIYLHPEQHRALLREASKKGISLAKLIREIIAKHLEEQARPVTAAKETFLRIVGMGASDKTDVSARHDHYLAEALKSDNG